MANPQARGRLRARARVRIRQTATPARAHNRSSIINPIDCPRDDQFLAQGDRIPTRTAPSETRPADVFPPVPAYRHDPLRAIRPDAPVSHAIAWDRAMLFRKVQTAVAPNVTAALPVQWQQSDPWK